jgi:hypothetical protein
LFWLFQQCWVWNKSLLLSGPSCSLLSPQLMGKLLTDACRCRMAPGSSASSVESYFRFFDQFRRLGRFFRPHLCRRFFFKNLGNHFKQIKEKFQGKLLKFYT